MAFTHLHVHSEYSLLDGLARVPDLVHTAKARGFDSLALTDHGVMYGAVRFYQEALAAGIKPILGCELYVARRTRHDRDANRDRRSYHLTALAANDRGYRNLLELVSKAQLEGFYYKPRVDHELLEKHSEGLIVLSGCPAAEVPQRLMSEQMDKARETMAWHKEVFGDRFFVELQNHDIDFLPELNRNLVTMAREMDLPLVATNDVHYARADDVHAHEVLLCIQTGTTMIDPNRMRIGPSFYLRTEEEMRSLFPELPEAIDNTSLIAEMCELELAFNEYKLPRFEVPDGETAQTYLRRCCDIGLTDRYSAPTAEVRERLDYELEIIHGMGFDDYFLIVWDLCRHARDQGIWWNVRGSGAGSIVAYVLGITNIDPIEHNLIFERFLNPSRVSMPDIDLDFPDDQRDDLIRYTFDKYGHDKVAQIITFGTLGARAAIRDAGRALDMRLDLVDRVARIVPAIPGKACGIDDVLIQPAKSSGESKEFYRSELADLYGDDDEVRHLLDTARGIEGVTRHASTHAAGVVVSDRPLVEYVPLHRPTRGGRDDQEPLPVTQFAMNDVDRLGLLKIDFLGLSTLTVLRRAAELIGRYHDKHYTLDSIPLDDPSIYELLASGNVTGVFQVEGAGMRKMLREMQPQQFEHVVAAVALYRPGPMEYIPAYIARLHGDEKITYRHPSLEPILAETYGICVYQEQIIRIARDLAGYNAGEADTIRKAVGKKIKEQLLRHRAKFVDGAVDNGIPKKTAEAIFDDIETFARYGFNKAHAADYAVITCQTAYFKANYPVEYMAALLSVDRDDTEKIALVAADCRRMGIQLLRPDISESDVDFSIQSLDAETTEEGWKGHERGIRFGLAAIKNVGEGAVHVIVDSRGAEPFADLQDLCLRVDMRAVGKRALESLIRAGALDTFGSRASLLASLERLVAFSASHHEAADAGQMSLFGDADPTGQAALLPPLPDVQGDSGEELKWEKDLIGLYLSEHPLHAIADEVAEAVTTMIGGIDESMDGQPVTLAGMVTSVRQVTTKKSELMAFVRLEDLQGAIEMVVFPRTYASTAAIWQPDALVLVRGRVELRDQRLQVIANSAEVYTPASAEERDRQASETGAQGSVGGPWDLAAGASPDAPSGGAWSDPGGVAWGESPVDALAPSHPAGDARSAAAEAEPWETPAVQPLAGATVGRDSPGRVGVSARGAGPANGPGAQHGASRATPGGAPEHAQPAEDMPQYQLLVTVPRDASEEADVAIALLKQVYQTLSSYEGTDVFRLYLPNGPETVELEFPNSTTRYCVGLTNQLEALLGDGQVVVRISEGAGS